MFKSIKSYLFYSLMKSHGSHGSMMLLSSLLDDFLRAGGKLQE